MEGYDAQNNLLYVDMGNGAILKLDGREISECDNGEDGVLFTPSPGFMPWKYSATPSEGLLQRTLVNPLNFAEGEATPYTPDQQRILFLMWLMALAFESIQPTKPLALAVGPAGGPKVPHPGPVPSASA